MNALKDLAIQNFRSGKNCAQAVLAVYADEYEMSSDMALGVSCGFGGGMGRLQETCGAVTGSFMVMGLHSCRKYADNKERKEKSYAMIQEFDRKFRDLHGTLNCKDLLKVDLRTEEGHQYMKDNNLSGKVCEKCIADAVNILGEILQ